MGAKTGPSLMRNMNGSRWRGMIAVIPGRSIRQGSATVIRQAKERTPFHIGGVMMYIIHEV
jgi:hypothetical protein